MTTELLICAEPTDNRWALGRLPVSDTTTLLVGWRTEAPAIDGGIPKLAARVIAQAMTDTAWVTFPTTAQTFPPGQEDPRLRTVRGSDAKLFLRAVFDNRPTAITTVSTRRPEIAVSLFDDAGFPWWLGAQTALLFDPDTLPPTLDFDTWLTLLSDQWAVTASSVMSSGLLGAIRAGVDGDVLGFAGATTEAVKAFSETVMRCAREHDVACAWVSEDQIG